MSDDDATDVAAAPADVRCHAEAGQDISEHEVSSALTQDPGRRHGRHQDFSANHAADMAQAIGPDHFGIELGLEFNWNKDTGRDAGAGQHVANVIMAPR